MTAAAAAHRPHQKIRETERRDERPEMGLRSNAFEFGAPEVIPSLLLEEKDDNKAYRVTQQVAHNPS